MKLRRLLAALLALALLLPAVPAMADDVCVVKDASSASSLTTDRSYLRVCCPLPGDVPVTLAIRDEWGYLVYQRDYGVCSGSFRSEDIYLRLDGSSAVYSVTLDCGDSRYQFRVTREMPRLTDTGVYAHGLALSQVTGKRGNKSVVIIDPGALEDCILSVPLVSGGMQLGYATFTVEDGVLTVDPVLTVDGTIEKGAVYVAYDAVTAMTLGTNRFTGTKLRLNRAIELHGTPYAAVMLQLTVSYDATTAQVWEEEPLFLEEQTNLWELMLLTTANEAVG